MLKNFSEPFAKKQYSPLNTRKFKELVQIGNESAEELSSKIGRLVDPKVTEFFKIIRLLYESEIDYACLMELSNSIYRKQLNTNTCYKNKLVGVDSQDEMTIFGNIETMSSISRLFISSLTDILVNDKQVNVDNSFWMEVDKNPSLQDHMVKSFDVGKVFNLNFLRIKSTYLTYFVTHRKQMEFLDFMKVGNEQLFEKWYKHCFELADMQKLEVIFERPIRRLTEWTAILEDLKTLTEDGIVLNSELCDNIAGAYDQYRSFEKYVENEITEFNGAVKYDFSLTPIEIIQSYGVDDKREEMPLQLSDNEIREKIANNDSKCLRSRNSNKTLDRSTLTASIFSGTSSRYSEFDLNSFVRPTLMSRGSNSNFKPRMTFKLLSNTFDSLTLADLVENFKKTHKGLMDLKKSLAKEDMLSIFDINLKHAMAWKEMIECLADNPSLKESADLFIFSMYKAYIDKLQRLREDATVMKVTEMEASVKEPLTSIIKHCDSVRAQLRDLNTLKKDYMMYLRERRSSVHDMKRDILASHFEMLQEKILHELPVFLELVMQALSLIVLNYQKLMLRYLEISAGGDLFLIRDLETLGKLKKDVGRNFDILDSYSSSRFLSKRYVRDNWEFEQDKTESRVLRKLFEL